MRILCLHGNHANSQIFKTQTAPLRLELDDDKLEYEFAEGTHEVAMADDLRAFAVPGSKYFAFFNPEYPATLSQAISDLDKYVSAEGPFDAVLGFSAGAVLSALYLLQKQRLDGRVPFKCGIFLSGASSIPEMQSLGFNPSNNDGVIQIPSAHIWGAEDDMAPTGGSDLSKLFDADQRLTLVHNGGHEVPRKESVTSSANVIRRILYAGGGS